ncbi:hypothetical protein V7128_07035 [Neobacillus vireti]|uniref:hypothetical protein n=1 Tax=Neobacillus vireti TaxID=220686 RepID=UPI002FFFB38A
MGILLLLSLFHFPVLGPSFSKNVNFLSILAIAGFSLLYSWIWMKISMSGMKQLNKRVMRKVLLEKND